MSKNVEERIQAAGNPIRMLRTSRIPQHAFPGVLPEYTNWRDEQESWAKSCILFNQSYHMADLYVRGPDAFRLLNDLGVNSFKNFKVDQAKQYVCCNYDGYFIGDVVLFYLAENEFNLVGRSVVQNWVRYHAEVGGYDVEFEFDQRTAQRPDKDKRKVYRFQVQGPNAMKWMEKATGETPPDLKFFHMTRFTIAGKEVRALRHGMAGQPGFELFGPWEDGEIVRQALIEAGEEFGLQLSGGRTYSSNTLESGWIPSPLPAIYTGEQMKAYREWLPAEGFEGMAAVGGSYHSDNVEDYYMTPWDLGYGGFVKFDHDFIGREALEVMAGKQHRRKVTLALNTDDVVAVYRSQLEKGPRGKYMEWPSSVYAQHPYDSVTVDGKHVGVSTWSGYSSNERTMLTLAVLDEEFAEPGTEVVLQWGEQDLGVKKPTVESHVIMPIRAIVSPVPYSEVARKEYSGIQGWRAGQS